MNDRILILSVAGEQGRGAERLLASFLDALPELLVSRCLLVRPARSSLARWTATCRARSYDWPAQRDAYLPNLVAALAAAWELRGERIALVHAWGARAFESALLLGFLLGVPVCGTLHDHPRATLHGRLRRTIIRWAGRRMRPLICVSRALADACRDAGWNAQLAVIPNGAPPLPPAAGHRAAGPVRVGFFGLYARWKGFEIVRGWIEQLGPAVEWHLCGDPAADLAPAVEELSRTRPRNVIMHGWIDGPEAMGNMDVLVHASTEFEPFGLVLIEAARAGIPVVASDLGGPQEIVEDGVTGFLFPASDPATGVQRLRALVEDPALRSRVGTAARRRFESHYTINRMVDAYLAIWRERLAS